MINQKIIKLASDTNNVGLSNKFSHKTSLKNTMCGDRITLELIAKKKKIMSMKYETESCVYCEAAASFLSKKIKKLDIQTIKNDFITLKEISKNKEMKFPKKFADFKKLLNSDNLNRSKCIFLPFDAVIKALKL
jgi:nitrogen fixation NifU-like protein